MTKIDPKADFDGTIECPSCGVRVKRNQNYCPICKYAFPHPAPRRQTAVVAVAIIMLVLLLVTIL